LTFLSLQDIVFRNNPVIAVKEDSLLCKRILQGKIQLNDLKKKKGQNKVALSPEPLTSVIEFRLNKA
jgi:hypothetical protein